MGTITSTSPDVFAVSQVVEYIASGPLIQQGFAALSAASAMSMTLALPTAGQDDGKTLAIVSLTNFAHVISTLQGNGFNGTYSTLTFNGFRGNGVLLTAFQGTWMVQTFNSQTGSGSAVLSGAGSAGILSITNRPLPNGVVGTAYSTSQTASGGVTPYTYSATGLPGGLSINPASGVISGTPTTATASTAVTVTATDSTTPTHLTASTTGLTITIVSALSISNTALPVGTVGTPYTAVESASGGAAPYTYSATGLPAGLNINSATGSITGTPTVSANASPVVVTVMDSTSPVRQTASTSGLTITIAGPLGITSNPLPNAIVGTAYSFTQTASGGLTPYTFSATGLPAGLTISTSTGAITGTPTTPTSSPAAVTITVIDSTTPTHQTASTTGLTMTVVGVPAGYSARYAASSIAPVANAASLGSWPDSSGNAYNATQATPANQPQYVTAAQTIAGLQPGVWFGAGTSNMNGAGPGGNAQQFFTIPTGLATNLVSCTIFVIGESGFSNEQYGPMVGLGQSSGIGPANFQNSLGYHKAGTWNGLSLTNLPTGPFAVCLESTAAAVTMTTEYSTSSSSGSAATALTGGAIGSAYATAASGGSAPFNCYQGMLQEVIIYSGTITASQKSMLFAYAAQQYGTATAKRPYNLMWYGNSVFLEWGAQTDGGMTAVTAKNPGTSYTLMNGINLGILGSGFTQQLSNVNYPKSLYDASASQNIVCLYDGDVDLGNGLTASQIYSEQLQLCQAFQAAGWKVVSSSLSNHNYAGAQLTVYNQYNALLRATPIGDAFADIAANPIFATYTPAYMSDTSHPNNAGHAILAPIFEAAILSLLGGGGGALSITSNTLPGGTVGTAYSLSQAASGGATPYTYSAVGLPAGLSINPANGMITGTPTAATGGAVAVTITATDSTTPTHQSASTTGLTITISAAAPLTITNNALPAGVVGTAYNASQTASGGVTPYTYSATGLPGGLSINSATGAITGTPTTAGGPTAVTITATDSTTPTHLTASTSGLTITVTSGGAGGTISFAHQNNPADITGSAAYACAATTAGNAMLFILAFRGSATDSVTSITGLGTATQAPGSRSVSTADGRASEIWQCLNIPGGVTSATINQTGTGIVTVIGIEVATTIGHFAFDAASAVTNATVTTAACTGAPITTTGSKDFVMCYVASLGITAFGVVSSPLVDTGLQDFHGNPYYLMLNLTPQTFTPTVQVTGFPAAYHWSTAAWTTQ